MVRYGGPRFEFYFTHQFLNNEQLIRKEDAQRVAFTLRRREQQKAAEVEREAAQQRQKEEEECATVREEEAKRRAASETEAKKSRISEKQRRLNELSRPVVRGGPLYGSGTYGRVMYPTATGVPLPQGRAGAAYMPGVDRHRIVPPPPAASAHPPWVGSGTAWMRAAAEERAERRYFFEASRRDPATARDTAQCVDGIERHHTRSATRGGRDVAIAEDSKAEAAQVPTAAEELPPESERAPSVFSHASSNEPIRALGTQHMETISKKEEVQKHLLMYNGQLAAPRPTVRPATPFDNMRLPELTVRLVRMQQRLQR